MSALLSMYPGDVFALVVANALVQITMVMLVALLLAGSSTRSSAAWRHTIYCVAIVCVLVSPVLSLLMQVGGVALLTLRPERHTASVVTPAIPLASDLHMDQASPPAVSRSAAVVERQGAAGHNQELDYAPPPRFSEVLRMLGGGTLMIWLFGSALLFARWCHGWRLVSSLRRRVRPLDGEVTADLLDEVRRALGVEELPPIATSVDVDRPVMIGLFRPLVILPASLLQTRGGPDLADILVHECAHAVCRHQVVGLLQQVAAMLFWPQPLVHLLNRKLARAREELCDNYVLRVGDAPHYARVLLELSQLLVGASPQAVALGLFHCRWRLEDRIAGLLDQRRSKMTRVNRWTTVSLIAAFLSLSLLVAGTRVLQAEATAGESGASTVTLSDPPDPSSPSDNGAVVQDDELRQSARHMYRVFIANEPDHRPVCIMDSDGSGLRPIVDMGKGRYAGSPRMSPDSKYIVFDVWAPATDVRAASAKVYVVGVDGGQLTDLGIGSMPTWVPNSQQITFFRHGRNFGLWVINRDGTLAARLNENGNSPRWSPDGKQIAFVRLGANGGVAVLDPKSGHERLITPARLPTGDVLDYRHGLDWSPDGTRLCVQCAQTPENMEIRLIDVQTGAITVRLNEQTGHSLSWSPKATKILFWMKGPEDQFNQLYVLSPDTKDPPERVAGQPRDRDNTDASWSADGKRIVFTSGMPSIENK